MSALPGGQGPGLKGGTLLPGPSGDLRKRPPSTLQMLAIAAAMAALCALMAGVS